MKKNFFKKLSFVMALAMLISCIAPAAGVFAAAKPALNATTKYLHLSGVSGPSEYDFNIKNKQTGWKYAWTSANEKVAVVDKTTGLTTATGVGSTKVTVKITNAGKAVATLSANVTVRDNIETVKIANAPESALKVNETFDFNRSFVTESGSTTKTSSVTRWTVDGTGATIDNAGKFVATTAGEYKVTAYSFQSAAKYEAWLTSKEESLVLDTDEVTVTVEASIESTKQVDGDTFTVTFDSDMSKTDVATASVLYQVINGKQVATGTEKIKSVKLDSTGKVATVELYAAVTAGTTYNYVYGNLVGSFTASTKSVDKIAGIVFNDFTVSTVSSAAIVTYVDAVDANGVVIYDGANSADAAVISGYLSYTYGGDTTKGNALNGYAYIYNSGYSATITATFNNYVYDSATSTYKAVSYTDSAVATGIVATAVASKTFETEDFVTATSSNWTGNLKLAAGDPAAYIHAKYQTNTDVTNSTYSYTSNTTVFTYKSSDSSKALVTGNSIYAIAAGTVTILVYSASDSSTVIGTFDVVISSARAFASATASKNVLTVGNNVANGEDDSATITVADSLGDPRAVTATADFVNAATSAVTPTVRISYGTGDYVDEVYVDVDGQRLGTAATAGVYNLKITLTDANNVSKYVYFSVNVLNGTTSTTVSYWKVEADTTSKDLNGVFSYTNNIKVYGYNSVGTRVDQLTPAEFDVTVTNASGTTIAAASSSAIAVVSGSGLVSVMYGQGTGSYTATATLNATGLANNSSQFAQTRVLGAVAFTVTDSTALTYTFDDASVASGSAYAVAGSAFTFYVDGDELADSSIYSVEYSVGGSLATSTASTGVTLDNQDVYISKVIYREVSGGSYKEYTYYPAKIVVVE